MVAKKKPAEKREVTKKRVVKAKPESKKITKKTVKSSPSERRMEPEKQRLLTAAGWKRIKMLEKEQIKQGVKGS